jgi:hypothetical protein
MTKKFKCERVGGRRGIRVPGVCRVKDTEIWRSPSAGIHIITCMLLLMGGAGISGRGGVGGIGNTKVTGCLLIAVEAAESCRLESAGIQVKGCIIFLMEVLDPPQAALVMQASRSLLATMPPLPTDMVVPALNRIIGSFLLDKHFSRHYPLLRPSPHGKMQ